MPAHADELVPVIVNKILKFQTEPLLRDEIKAYEPKDGYLNELLFFIKPEITVESPKIKLDLILNLVLGKVESFGFAIQNIKILNSKTSNKS